jgi:hypothetical protein
LNHEERIVDPHRDMDWLTIWTRSTHLLDGAKRRSAEIHFGFWALADQHREDGLHTIRNRLNSRHRIVSSMSPTA